MLNVISFASSMAASHERLTQAIRRQVLILAVLCLTALSSADSHAEEPSVLTTAPDPVADTSVWQSTKARQRRVAGLLAIAKYAFQWRDYGTAAAALESCLVLDPENEAAQELQTSLAAIEAHTPAVGKAIGPEPSAGTGALLFIEARQRRVAELLAIAEYALQHRNYERVAAALKSCLALDPKNEMAREIQVALGSAKANAAGTVVQTTAACPAISDSVAQLTIAKQRRLAELLAIAESALWRKDYDRAEKALEYCFELVPQSKAALEFQERTSWMREEGLKSCGFGNINDWAHEDEGTYQAFVSWAFADQKCRYRFSLVPAFVPFQLRRVWILVGCARFLLL